MYLKVPVGMVPSWCKVPGQLWSVLCMFGLLSTIIRERERADQESVTHEKIALAHEHN